MKVLVACEESQAVCKAFRELGHEAYSCDIQECSGGHPEWHIIGDAIDALYSQKWDLVIAHPPCTYLTVTGNRWFNVDRYGEKAMQRLKDREAAADFFMVFAEYAGNNNVNTAIENPIGYMSTHYRKPDQIIHPYMFGDPARKANCLWLRGLQPLEPTKIVEPEIIAYKNGKGTDNPWHMDTMKLPTAERSKARSKTFPGIAKAMAEQLGGDIRE